MIAYRQPGQPAWAPARVPARRLGQEAPAAPAAPPAAPGRLLDLGREEVQTFLIAQGVSLAYALTAGFFYGKKSELVDRVLLGVGGLGFGVASWSAYRMAAALGANTATQVTGGVMGSLDALAGLGAVIGSVKPKVVRRSIPEAAAAGLPI